MTETIPEDPVEGGRVYKPLTMDRFETLASNHESYRRAKALVDAVDAGWTDGLTSALAGEGVHLFGFEVVVAGDVPEPSFPGVTGGIGLAVVWLSTGGDPPLAGPALYSFAVERAAGPTELSPAPTGETTGNVFVANYGGETPGTDDWCLKLALTTVGPDTPASDPLSGELTTFDVPGATFLLGLRDVWYAYGGDISLSGGDAVTVSYRGIRYRHFEWLVGALGLRDAPDGGIPDHRSFTFGLGEVPNWSAEVPQITAGEFTVGSGAPGLADPLARYGGSALRHGIEGREDDVKRLQADLWELGFWFAGLIGDDHGGEYDWTPDDRRMLTVEHARGAYDAETEWAVREFQAYASMPSVARLTGDEADHYANSLERTANTDQYRGDLDGRVDERTAALIQSWLDDDWRCPVVVEARQGDHWETVTKENVWNRETVESNQPRVFARDFTDRYTVPEARRVTVGEPDEEEPGFRITLGQTTRSGGGGIGPHSLQEHHAWPEGEMTPENLAGVDRALLAGDDDLRTTYKVVRAMADRENEGFFDVINGWDAQVISLGPYHWIFRYGTVGDALGAAELGGYMSYLKEQEPAAFDDAVGDFGLDVARAWNGDGGGLILNSRKYESQFELTYHDGTRAVRSRDRDYPRTWHWFYRWIMAARVNEQFRQRMWDMARVRLRDILEAEMPAGEVGNVPTSGGGNRTARVGDVFRSEMAVALLLRWHVYRPANVVSNNRGGDAVTGALADARDQVSGNAAVNYTGNPRAWPDTEAYGEPLAEGFIREIGAGDVDIPNAETTEMGFETRTNETRGEETTYDMYLHSTDGWVAVEAVTRDTDDGSEVGREWSRYAGAIARADLDAGDRFNLVKSLNEMRDWPDDARIDSSNHQDAIDGGNDNFYQMLAPAAAGGEDAGRLNEERGSFGLHDDGLPAASFGTVLTW